MMREIHEQDEAVAETIADRLPSLDRVDLGDVDISEDFARRVSRIVIVAAGTAYHAGLVGRYAIELWTRIPIEMDIASEYRYRNPVVSEKDLVIGITQSGETADTLAAMRLARERGAKVLAITNVMGSEATRVADTVLYTRAGLEVSVAATKTFTAQVAAMYLLGLWLAQVRRTWPQEELTRIISELKGMPSKIEETVQSTEERVRAIARTHAEQRFFLYLGRNIGLPVCLEGALKMREISYIPTDAYAAGEMKHGPIALLDESTPVVCVATDGPILEKVLSNMAEVRARGADVVAIATEGTTEVEEYADQTIYIPRTDWVLQPILAVIPLQLLAYHVARRLGLNVDQPRNLAKTVTVEWPAAPVGPIPPVNLRFTRGSGARARGGWVRRWSGALLRAGVGHGRIGPHLPRGDHPPGREHPGHVAQRRAAGRPARYRRQLAHSEPDRQRSACQPRGPHVCS
jgi:glucosamine--fructose-6-phosphate aminotransferase (isomerizing)